tara:strand:+ start:1414 stop:2442 length:1029 start_codon:yes stop_codon:yes gene_type:complete
MKASLQINNSIFSSNISTWYKNNGRENLPWRKNISPYRIWISEIMLQQTQVKTVIPFFKVFIKKYPNLKSLSLASEENILALWTGLGFYRRAKNIYKAKEIIKNNFDNTFPKKFEDIISLPGIGESTAGAIMSLAYKESYPILDANVKRVIARYEMVENNSTSSSIKKLWGLSKKLTPKDDIFEYTQGIMDLGATVCNIHDAKCVVCPLHSSCSSAYDIVKAKKTITRKIKPMKRIHFVLACSDNSVLLFKKNEKTFWESLWTPYEIQAKDSSVPFDKKVIKKETINKKHKLSHLDLDMTIDISQYENTFNLDTNLEYKWINKTDIDMFGLPKPIKTIIERL